MPHPQRATPGSPPNGIPPTARATAPLRPGCFPSSILAPVISGASGKHVCVERCMGGPLGRRTEQAAIRCVTRAGTIGPARHNCATGFGEIGVVVCWCVYHAAQLMRSLQTCRTTPSASSTSPRAVCGSEMALAWCADGCCEER